MSTLVTKLCAFRKVMAPALVLGTLVMAGDPLLSQSGATAGRQDGQRKTLTFRLISRSEIVDEGGTKQGFRTVGGSGALLSGSTFEASDGERLAVRYAQFESRAEAQRYFRYRLSEEAKTILEQGDKKDENGSAVGSRAEAVTTVATQKAAFAIMWTAGNQFRAIYSRSLPDAVDLEKRYAGER